MKNFKRGLRPMTHEISLSRSMSLKTFEQRADMDRIPYALVISSIMYAMLIESYILMMKLINMCLCFNLCFE